MGVLDRDGGTVQGKIVYFGAKDAGTTTNAIVIERKLKSEHRGELRVLEVRHPPHTSYEFLPVHLGDLEGHDTTLHIHTVPTGPGCVEERRRLLDGADGVVFVADLRPDRTDETVEAFDELCDHLATYGLSPEDVPILTQFNHSDEAVENGAAILHHTLGFEPVESLEAVASEGVGVLESLTTLTKFVLEHIRSRDAVARPPQEARPSGSEEESEDKPGEASADVFGTDRVLAESVWDDPATPGFEPAPPALDARVFAPAPQISGPDRSRPASAPPAPFSELEDFPLPVLGSDFDADLAAEFGAAPSLPSPAAAAPTPSDRLDRLDRALPPAPEPARAPLDDGGAIGLPGWLDLSGSGSSAAEDGAAIPVGAPADEPSVPTFATPPPREIPTSPIAVEPQHQPFESRIAGIFVSPLPAASELASGVLPASSEPTPGPLATSAPDRIEPPAVCEEPEEPHPAPGAGLEILDQLEITRTAATGALADSGLTDPGDPSFYTVDFFARSDVPSEERVPLTSEPSFELDENGSIELRDGGLSVPLRLIDRESGHKVELRLYVRLEL